MDAERLLGQLLMGGLTGGRRSRGGGLGGGLGRAAVSTPGLMLLGGLAVAAYEHLTANRGHQGASAGAPGSGTGQTGGPYPPPPPPPVPGASPPPPPLPASSAQSSPPPYPTPGATRAPHDNAPLPFAAAMGLTGAPSGGVPGGATAGAPGSATTGGALTGPGAAMLLIEAMVGAAKADGTIDAAERARILDRLAEQGALEAEGAWILALMEKPFDLEGLVARVADDPVLAGQVYAASLVAINMDTAAEQAYLTMLATRLGLSEAVTTDIARRVADLRGPAT
jgi:uncharacterized membrane protein YebE (DUF533 family)